MAKGDPLLEVRHLVKRFPIKEGLLIEREVAAVHAVDDVSLTLHEGETLGLVGESGCGKSTLCRTIIQLLKPTSGSVKYLGKELVGLSRKQLQPVRRDIQMIFQDPYASLNPRKRVGQIIGDQLRLHGLASGSQLRREVQQLMERVGLQAEHYNRFPHEFSGGQRQRIGIARALALRPKLIIADEPVSALDVSIQAQIINLLDDLQDEFDLSYIFVAHDLGVVRHVSDRIAVMYLGKIVERSPAAVLYERPIHPYSVALLSAVPIPDPRVEAERQPLVLEGDVPSPVNPPPACHFHTRCPWATEICSQDEPPLAEYESGQAAACHHPRNVDSQMIAGARTRRGAPPTARPEMTAERRPLPWHFACPSRPGTTKGRPPDRSTRRAPRTQIDSFLRVLALDYGTARCGCAISDPSGTLVRPLAAIEPPDPEAIAELVAAEGAERVIVGLPTTLSGEEGEQAKLSKEFAAELSQLIDVPVETYDERLTTRMAERSAREGARADRDSLAAAHLLESYLMGQGER